VKAGAVTTYCIDTSCLIAAWDERYPPENFPKFWEYLDKLIGAGRVRAPEAVLDETSKRSKELHDWLKERPDLFIGYETDIQLEVKTILAKYPKLVAVKKTAFSADSFIIATAKVKGFVVVTEEGPTGKLQKPNIPDVCRDHGIDCINLIQLIRAEAWVIS
jgi:hypothetical protein